MHHLIVAVVLTLPFAASSASIGICYGRVANNLPPPFAAVDILKTHGVPNVRVFNTDPTTLAAFIGSGINLMIGVPNEDLPFLASAPIPASIEWLNANIFTHIHPQKVRYIAVGNEVFLKDPYYAQYVVPAALKLYDCLKTLGLAEIIKISSPQAASVLINTYPPSFSMFNPSIQSDIISLLKFLKFTKSPFMANVYPYISYVNNYELISSSFASFGIGVDQTEIMIQDGVLLYQNLFDASIDAFVFALEKEGFGGLEVVVSETGWPTAGGVGANEENAMAFNGNVVRRAKDNIGTPKRPGVGLEIYLFGLFDEDEKGGEEYERHFGIFRLDGVKAYDLQFQ